eukprot:11311985-Heterocapsa_arctica.AAC.1
MHRMLRNGPDLREGGIQSEGKREGKTKQGGLSALPRKRGLSTHSAPKGNNGQSEQKGKGTYGESTEIKKLGQMRTTLKAAEAIQGWEDKVEELKADIKEQKKLSNQEHMITREAQGLTLLQQVSCETKENA